jgi:hypothetical protein
MSQWGQRLLLSVAFMFLVTGMVLAGVSARQASIKDMGDEKQTLSAGWYRCGGSSACKVCTAAGGCGAIASFQKAGVTIYYCTPALNPFIHGKPGCTTAANVKHCVFTCLPNSCAVATPNTAACGNYQTLAGSHGCVPNAANTACAPSTCANSGNQGQICYDCQ